MLRDHGKYLYHYTTPEALAEHILPKRQIRFSTFAKLNDPYEFKSLRLNWHTRTQFADDFTGSAQEEFSQILKRDMRVACFTGDPPAAQISPAGGDFLMPAYERGHSLPHMWAHYANNHAGACLVFDKAALDAAIREGGHKLGLSVLDGPVAYSNWPAGILSETLPRGFTVDYDEWRQVGPEVAARAHIRREWRSLFLAKTMAWASEREHRWLLYGEAPEYVHLTYGSALVGILLGQGFPNALKARVGKIALRDELQVAELDWLNGFPQPHSTHPRLLTNTTR